LPYNVSAPILSKLIRLYRDGLPLQDATLMLQREVADRVVANAGTSTYGPLAVMVQLYSDATRVLTLPPGAFRPVPKVRSAVVRLTFRRAAVPLPDPATFDKLVRSLFSQRRKTVLNALKPFASQCGLAASDLLSRTRLDGGRRPGELDLAELAELAEVLVSARQEAVL
jgi:16S rRNA (adenine1518-N6/adenine1519-N6)-dimethyltransferase